MDMQITHELSARITDHLPIQPHYYMLHDGLKYAKHGGSPDVCGVLVFPTQERAEEFNRTVGRTLSFRPVRVTAEEFLREFVNAGAFSLADGLTVKVLRIGGNIGDE